MLIAPLFVFAVPCAGIRSPNRAAAMQRVLSARRNARNRLLLSCTRGPVPPASPPIYQPRDWHACRLSPPFLPLRCLCVRVTNRMHASCAARPPPTKQIHNQISDTHVPTPSLSPDCLSSSPSSRTEHVRPLPWRRPRGAAGADCAGVGADASAGRSASVPVVPAAAHSRCSAARFWRSQYVDRRSSSCRAAAPAVCAATALLRGVRIVGPLTPRVAPCAVVLPVVLLVSRWSSMW
jgi:hypothetical protein